VLIPLRGLDKIVDLQLTKPAAEGKMLPGSDAGRERK
jgi:hypothetical protein